MQSSVIGNPSVWGPPTWTSMHIFAARFPEYFESEKHFVEVQRKYSTYFDSLKEVLPCGPCRRDYTQLLEEYPVEKAAISRYHLSRWVWNIHNIVNRKLRKREFSWTNFVMKYGSLNQYPQIGPKDNVSTIQPSVSNRETSPETQGSCRSIARTYHKPMTWSWYPQF